jgi:hypothetical protein
MVRVKARQNKPYNHVLGESGNGYAELHFALPAAYAYMFPVGFAIKIQVTSMGLSKGYVWRDERDNNENP